MKRLAVLFLLCSMMPLFFACNDEDDFPIGDGNSIELDLVAENLRTCVLNTSASR